MNEDAEEAIHHDHVLRAFRAYRLAHIGANNLRRQSYYSLSEAHRDLLPNQLALLNTLDHCIVANAEFLEDVATFAKENGVLSLDDADDGGSTPSAAFLADIPKPKITENEMDKLRSTLRQLHRDWSDEGNEERNKAYLPIIQALEERRDLLKKPLKVLVPGCGLGRLPFDIAQRGFTCQGNEFSMYMLYTASYILNNTSQALQYPIHPFCHSLSNIYTAQGATREIMVPDVLPSECRDMDLSMAAGDFLEIYKDDAGQWDALVTCFFIDTAHNIIEYLESIKRLLKPDGIWINLGPSLWHFEGNTSGSIDIPMDEVKRLAGRIGFRIQDEQEVELTYTTNPASCMRYTYRASFWTATVV